MKNGERSVAVFARVSDSHFAPKDALDWMVDICVAHAEKHGLPIATVERDVCSFNYLSPVLEALVANLRHLDEPTILIAQPSQLSPASRMLLKAYKIRLLTALPRNHEVNLKLVDRVPAPARSKPAGVSDRKQPHERRTRKQR